MNDKKLIDALLARFMAAETTEAEESLLVEFFRTATDIPAEWQPYADMFRILDDGATRLTESELEPVRRGVRLPKWAASLIFMIGIGAVAATVSYHITEKESDRASATQALTSERGGEKEAISDTETPSLAEDITFDNKTLAEIAAQIKSLFGCKVVLADKETADLRLYFTLPKGSTATDFANIIDEYETLSAQATDSVITITRQEAQQ